MDKTKAIESFISNLPDIYNLKNEKFLLFKKQNEYKYLNNTEIYYGLINYISNFKKNNNDISNSDLISISELYAQNSKNVDNYMSNATALLFPTMIAMLSIKEIGYFGAIPYTILIVMGVNVLGKYGNSKKIGTIYETTMKIIKELE